MNDSNYYFYETSERPLNLFLKVYKLLTALSVTPLQTLLEKWLMGNQILLWTSGLVIVSITSYDMTS